MVVQPLVSIITATYNMGQYLREAVDSVLAQDYPRLEVIVVDDGSSDDTPEILRAYDGEERVRVVRQENSGQAAAKNRGLSEARGELVGFCDADNRWLSGKLTCQVPCLTSSTATAVVYGDIAFIDSAGRPLPAPPQVDRYSGWVTGRLLINNFVTFNTALVPLRILKEVGGFDESLSMSIDYDLWLRISTKYEFQYLPKVLAEYRIWGGQMSHRTGERLGNALRLMANFLASNPDSVTAMEARRGWAHTYTTRGLWHASEGRRREALRDYGRAMRHHPFEWRLWKSLAKLLL